MIDLIKEMFVAPDAQVSAYSWLATYGGHFAIGVVIMSGILCLPRTSPKRLPAILTAAYGLFWEGLQWFFYSADITDCLVDTIAVGSGVFVAGAMWRRRTKLLCSVLVIYTTVAVWGVQARKETQ